MPPLRLSPEEFRELADRVAIAATDYLASMNDRPIFPTTTGPRTQAVFGQPLAEEGLGAAAFDDLVDVMEHARAGNGRFFGYVLGSGEPIAALADFYASVLNQNVTAWRQADSISLDAHKWLYQPLDCSVVLYRDAEVARATFAYSGDYARSLSEDPTEGFSFFEESIELSRRFRALKLWLSLRYHGLGQFREAIREDLRHAQLLTQLIDAEPALERLAPTELSAVCFRWNGGPEQTLNHRNVAILRDVIRRGCVYLSNATLRGKFALRACIVNHRTTDDDISAIVEEVLAAAEQTA